MSKFIEVEKRLNIWAAWFIAIQTGEIGWPEKSTLALFMEQGFIPNDKTSRSSSIPYHSPKAEEINVLINLMRKEKPKCAYAIIHFYLTRSRVIDLARECDVKKNTFYEWLRKGKIFIQERLKNDL